MYIIRVKGDRVMRNVEIVLNGIGYGCVNQVDVCIYDECDNLVCKSRTYNGRVKVRLCKNRVYKLVSCYLSQMINQVFYVNRCSYSFSFESIIVSTAVNNSITFLLTDYYYDNLPIERGSLIL